MASICPMVYFTLGRMQKRPLPPKPIWYQYTYEAQMEVDAVKPSRSGSNEDRVYQRTFGIAQAEKGYPGTLADWHDLLAHIRRTAK
jgi:hypothetical protein